jgi:hypothetical protein
MATNPLIFCILVDGNDVDGLCFDQKIYAGRRSSDDEDSLSFCSGYSIKAASSYVSIFLLDI